MPSWSEIQELFACLVLAGPLAFVALASFGASALVALALVGSAVAARWSLGSRSFGRIAALVVVTFLVGAAATALVVKGAHAMILNPPPSLERARPFHFAYHEGIDRSRAAWFFFSVALSVVATLSLVATLVRGGENAPLASLVAFLCALTGVGLLHIAHDRASLDCFNPSGVYSAIAKHPGDPIAVADLPRLVLVAAAVIGSVIVVWFDRKNRTDPSEAEEEAMLGRGAAVFAFGFAAFFATRGMAFDARRLIPLREVNEGLCPKWPGMKSEQEARVLPPAGACEARCGIEVHLDEGGAWVDGMDVSGPSTTVTNPSSLEEVLKDKRSLYESLLSKPPSTFVVTIVAAEDLPVRDVAPWIAAAQRAHDGAISIAGVHPAKRISSATRGEIELLPRCCCSALRIDPSAAPITSRATWGEVARASQRGEAFSITFRER